MNSLVSKLQYKTYETGEYLEEKARNLEETLMLIHNFPWEEQRHLIDIKLTSPSVTIQNNEGEYLKLGLFFNNKYCVYLFGEDNHFYEAHFSTLKEACEIVTDFFNNQLSYKKFEKHFLSFNQKHYFDTKIFNYQIGWRQLPILSFLGFLSIVTTYACYLLIGSNTAPWFVKVEIPLTSILFTFKFLY